MTLNDYNACVDRYADGVYRFILKNMKDSEAARDVVQESYTRLWERVREVPFDKAKPYLYTTAYHAMIDHLRKYSRLQAIDESLGSWENPSHGMYSDLKEVLDEAVAKLPAIQRSVVLLRDYEGYSYEEIGEITKLSESQVKVYIFRARTFLKQYIGSLEAVI